MNGFYYNHYNIVDGTARYVDGPYDTLEEAVKVMRDYHPQAVEIDGSAPDVEEDSFDDIDPQQVREELAKSGIVDGKLVDPEALNNTPFIRQVMTDVGAAEPFSAWQFHGPAAGEHGNLQNVRRGAGQRFRAHCSTAVPEKQHCGTGL